MNPISRQFQIFVKPVSGRCNLDCHYCYYLDKEAIYPSSKKVLMPEEILEKYISQHMEAVTEPVIGFSWHGGEPCLAGIEFFRKVVEIQKRHQPPGTKVINGIQTNGTQLNEEWCEYLAEEDFMVGISMDGPPEMHNHYRVSNNQKSTFNQVLQGYKMLQKFHISTEILCVVHDFNVNYPLDVYRFFKELGVHFLTFLPLVERLPAEAAKVSSRSVRPLAWGKFLITVFDEWVEKDIGSIKIQIFEEATRTAFKQDHTLCIFKKTCGGVPVIEQNGDFYSCDHYVSPEHRLGNVSQNTLVELLDHPQQKTFGQAKKLSLPHYCLECEVLDMCNGECPKNRFITTPSGEEGLNYLCEGYKLFFKHCQPFVEAVASQWS